VPRAQFGLTSYERAEGDLPELPVVNMYAEEAPTEEGGIILQSRRGLDDRNADMGTGPVDCLFRRDLVLDGALFGVSDSAFYEEAVQIGFLDGDGPFSIAGYQDMLFIAGGGSLWGFDGSTLTAIALPDSFSALKVIVGGSRVVVLREDTGKFYWSDPLEDDIEALDFATAENQPDRALDMLFIDGVLRVFGAETVELWPLTTDDELPFQPLLGSVIERGIRGTGCATAIGSTFAWVTNLNEVCLQDENNVLSNPGLQAKIETSETVRLFTFQIDGIEFLALRLDTETQIWSARTKLWSEFASYDEDNWLPQCFAGGVFGSAVDGKTFSFGDDHTDLGSVLERRFRAGFPLNSGGVSVDNVQLRTNVGQTPFLTGDYLNPTVEMRVSRDAGNTWSDWRPAPLGAQGQYRTKVQWRRCGMASQPGFLAEFRVTDPVPFRMSDVLLNEPYGGR
jgi:hypothetical protein